MPTYRQTFSKRGHERVDYALIVSDTYAGLRVASPTDVNGIMGLGTSKKDLDTDVGVQAADQLDLTLDKRLAVTQDDLDCVAFILDAQGARDDVTLKRYVGLTINQAGATPTSDDWEFRGVIEPAMSGAGSDWKDGQFGTEPDPDWAWKLSAISLEIADFLDVKLEQIVASIVADDPDWVEASVKDRLGWFHRDADTDDYGHREGRYGSMVNLQLLLNRLLEEAMIGQPVDVFLENADLAMTPFAAHFIGLSTTRPSGILGLGSEDIDFRYGDPTGYYPTFDGTTIWDTPPGATGAQPYQIRSNPEKDPLFLSDIYVSWRLLTPRSEAQAISWLGSTTIGGLIHALAYSLGTWVQWRFVSDTQLNCTFLTRKDASSSDTIYVADAVTDEIDVSPNDSATKRMQFPASLYATEGRLSSYRYDGAWGPARPWSGAKSEEGEKSDGPYSALSIAPTVCVLWDKSFDAGVEFHAEDEYHLAPMPHNGIFYNDTDNRENEGFPGADLVDVHTAMYIGFTAPPDDPCTGCASKQVVRPIGAIQYEYYNSILDATIVTAAHAIETYLADIRRIDYAAYKVERRIRVPYITKFRLDPGGTDDWRVCRPGQKIPFDGVVYLIAGIERDFDKGTTTIRLHATSRLSFAENSSAFVESAPSSSISLLEGHTGSDANRRAYPAGSPIARYAAVIADPDGRVHEAPADGWSYGRVLGIATRAAAGTGDRVEIATGGFVELDADYFTAGASIYLRSSASPHAAVANLSSIPVRYVNAEENLHQVIATAMSTRRLRIELQRPVFLTESASVKDMSTFTGAFV